MTKPAPANAVSKCVECGVKTLGRPEYRRRRAAGTLNGCKRRETRGLCQTCYTRNVRSPQRVRTPRDEISRETLFEEIEFLMDGGTFSLTTLAERVGMKRGTMRDNLSRAARQGDGRAIKIRERITP